MSRNWKIPLEGDPELTTLLTHAPLARTNLCLQSQDFGTTWANQTTAATINTNVAVAPDGTMTADRLIDDASTGTGGVLTGQAIVLTAATEYTFSLYAKADQLSWIRPQIAGMGALDTGAYFDLANGAIGTVGTNNTSTFITDVGNGWYRCGFTFTSDAADVNVVLYIWAADGNGDITVDIDGTSSVLLWGVQLEESAAPTPYISTTTVARTINSRTNLCVQSEDLSGTGWTRSLVTVAADQAVAPDNETTANLMTATASLGQHRVFSDAHTTLNATVYTSSIYAKAGTYNFIQLHDAATGTFYANFDLSTGVVTAESSAGVGSITDAGEGWYRIGLKFTTATTNLRLAVLIPSSGSAVRNESWTALGTETVYIWGAQAELGTTPTNYIPTTTAAVTVTGYIPRGSLVDDMHQALETVLEDTGNINDLWKRYKQLN